MMRDQLVIDYLKSKGIKVIDEDISSNIDIWTQWYKGNVDKVHEFYTYEGKKKLKNKLKSLKMGSRVCQDWADLLINERVDISVNDEYTQKVLNRLLKQVNFYVKGNNLIEASFAKGGGYLIQYWDGKKTNQKYITQDYCNPITYDGARLVEAAFSSKKVIAGKKYTYIETHLLDENGFYVIDNVLLTNDSNKLKEVDESFYEKHGIQMKVETKSKEPLFQCIRPNIANKNDLDSVYGTSVFADALDVLECIDIAYDAHHREIKLGKKRIFAKDSVTNVHIDAETGKEHRVFDPNDEAFYLLKGDMQDGQPPIIECNMTLRIEELNKELQTQLDILSQLCGFGNGYYRWENGNVTTATQVISSNSKMFRTLKKHEGVLNDAIVTMTRGLLYIESLYTQDNKIKYDEEITIDFDDSIIEDTSEKKRQATADYNMELISKAEYFRQVYNMDEQQAIDYANRMIEERANELKLEMSLSSVIDEPQGA